MYSAHFKALLKKNLLIFKRNYILSIVEILSPIIVMILFWRLKQLFKIEHLEIEEDDDYIYSNGTYLRNIKSFDDLLYDELPYKDTMSFCYGNLIIALIGENFPEELFEQLNLTGWELFGKPKIKYYKSLEELNDYILSDKYNTDKENRAICFGISYIKTDNKYTFKMHYFTSLFQKYTPSIPSTSIENLDPFRTQPDFESYEKYMLKGFLMVIKIIYDYILQKETNNKDAEINLRIMAQKYDNYLYSLFNSFLSMILGFFILIAYALPLSINIFKLVKE